MAFRYKTILRTLIFITLGAIAIGFTDIVILNKKHSPDPYWWSHNIFTTIASWSSNSNIVDVEMLKSRHASYMEAGIIIPKGATDNSLQQPGATNITAVNDVLVEEKDLSAIEPASGNESSVIDESVSIALKHNNNDPSVGLEVLGLEEEDITNIFLRRNVEDVILSHGEVPEFTPKVENDSKLKRDIKVKTEAIDNEIYEVYKHAPIEVEDKYTEDDFGKAGVNYIKPTGNGKIAIIIDDMGISLRSKLVEILPGPLTLSYLPYAENLAVRTKRARNNGHELMVHIPMEPLNGNLDGGPRVLKASQSEKGLLDTLDWGLSQFDGYVGINNHMGSKITADKKAMDQIMKDLKKRNLFFVDSRTIGSSVAAHSAREAGIPYAVRDIFIDHEVTPEFIQGALANLETKAATRGYVIAIGHPHKETIDALKEWIPTLKDKGFTLVPASNLLNQPLLKDAQASLN